MLVRKASHTDVSLIVSFIEKQAAYDLQLGFFQGTLTATAERINKALFGSPVLAHALLVATGAVPSGLALYQFRFSPSEGRASVWIDLLYVDETARRRGCGMALMEALSREAVTRDCNQLAWSIDERNALAGAFFAKLHAPIVAKQEQRLIYSIPVAQLASRDPEKRLRGTRPPLAPLDSRSPLPPATQFGVVRRLATYKLLVAADAYRDGGSLEVRFKCSDGSFETVWLQASLDPDFGVRYIHTDLTVFADVTRDGAYYRIAKQSREEDAILDAMLNFLRYPKVEVPFSHRTPDSQYLQIVEALIAAIPNRVPSGPEGAARP